jgi:hypothetical protein
LDPRDGRTGRKGGQVGRKLKQREGGGGVPVGRRGKPGEAALEEAAKALGRGKGHLQALGWLPVEEAAEKLSIADVRVGDDAQSAGDREGRYGWVAGLGG